MNDNEKNGAGENVRPKELPIQNGIESFSSAVVMELHHGTRQNIGGFTFLRALCGAMFSFAPYSRSVGIDPHPLSRYAWQLP
jgi:hypothetical protein